VSFALASVLGVTFGLLIGNSRRTANVVFPPVELLRSIPPIAWVPATILLLPTTEASLVCVTSSERSSLSCPTPSKG
jgi:NitT/TauT family transport system permease protein